MRYFRSFNSYALFCYKNKNFRYTNCPISTHPAKKVILACMLRMPMFSNISETLGHIWRTLSRMYVVTTEGNFWPKAKK